MKHIPSLMFTVLALLAWVLVSRFNPKELGAMTPTTLTPMENKGVDLVTEMNKLIVAILLFAVCLVFGRASLLAQKPAWQPSPGHTQAVAAGSTLIVFGLE